MKLKAIASSPVGFIFSIFHRANPKNSEDIKEKFKPQEVIVVPTPATKAAMYRDWVMAMCFGLFAGITINDKLLKPNNTDRVDALIKNLDLNGDSHISQDELEKIKELIKTLEDLKRLKT